MTGVNLLGVLALVDVLTLLVTSLLLVYPLVRHSHNVAYRSGFVLLAVAFFLLTAAAVDAFVFGRGLRNTAVAALASAAALGGTWAFARPFCSLDPLLGRAPGGEFAADAPGTADATRFEGRFDGSGDAPRVDGPADGGERG